MAFYMLGSYSDFMLLQKISSKVLCFSDLWVIVFRAPWPKCRHHDLVVRVYLDALGFRPLLYHRDNSFVDREDFSGIDISYPSVATALVHDAAFFGAQPNAITGDVASN
jgi:hypothetical protein